MMECSLSYLFISLVMKMEPRASHTLGKLSVTESHLQALPYSFAFYPCWSRNYGCKGTHGAVRWIPALTLHFKPSFLSKCGCELFLHRQNSLVSLHMALCSFLTDHSLIHSKTGKGTEDVAQC